jgi:hypothetical protein
MNVNRAVLQLRLVSAVLRYERLHERANERLAERGELLMQHAAESLNGSAEGAKALAEAQHELDLFSPPGVGRMQIQTAPEATS